MKKVTIFICFVFSFLLIHAQKKSDIGIFSGGSYYIGDINLARQFYSPSIAVGGIYRYNINLRYSLRGNIYYGGLKGDDLDFNNDYQIQRGARFNASIIDCSIQFEFNFFPYQTTKKKNGYSTYVTAGLGYTFFIGSDPSLNHLMIPFGVGFKININKRLSAGLEWDFRKTFSDNIDGLQNLSNTVYKSFIHNNDWYSFAGIFLTYRIFRYIEECPAYF